MAHLVTMAVESACLLFRLGGQKFEFACLIEKCTNNQAKYEALMRGFQMLREIEVRFVEVFGDSLLIINQLLGKYDCKIDALLPYFEECRSLINQFAMVTLEHIPRHHNGEANRLTQRTSGYRSVSDVVIQELPEGDWRKEIVKYLKKYYPSIWVNS